MSASSSPRDDSLWERIRAFDLDHTGGELTFTRRLARENGWSHTFASRVIAEYKRFVYLAMIAGHEVTPSDEVDQAWHLHLTYTRSYWDELCGEVLGRPLHHGPTKGGSAEAERFEDQYERTLASYHAAFGDSPPSDIWPPANIRFDQEALFVRVNTKQRLILSRSQATRTPMLVGGLAVLGIAGAAPHAPLAALDTSSVVVTVFVVVIAILVLRAFKGGGGGGGAGCGGFFGCGGDSGCGGGGCGGGCGGGD